MDYDSLNKKQQIVFERIKSHYHSMLTNSQTEPLRIIIMGTAGTGVAAFNIGGRTVHSALSIPICNNSNNLDINGERLKILQQKLEGVKYIIIDEKTSTCAQSPHEVYKLDVIQRQSGDSEEQQKFREILLQLRNGESTMEDWVILSSRLEDKQSREECNRFLDAVYILTRWINVEFINKLRSLNHPVVKILAVHTGGREAKNADSDMAKGLEAQLFLAKGARIMLTANLWTAAGLVNGSMGTIHDIIYNDQGPPYLPTVVFISFDKYKGPTIRWNQGCPNHTNLTYLRKQKWKSVFVITIPSLSCLGHHSAQKSGTHLAKS
ncbi:6884_t:CDS:2 [Paraglomus occultum]|uniref:ATP-dependent DNA helicase n=1 Tax=Paraglomus occultum TaxID=144539 RepID=A0A9N9GBG1_9GLOM|nr:6884_t:CDS:2 [Paraglomus occultum]